MPAGETLEVPGDRVRWELCVPGRDGVRPAPVAITAAPAAAAAAFGGPATLHASVCDIDGPPHAGDHWGLAITVASESFLVLPGSRSARDSELATLRAATAVPQHRLVARALPAALQPAAQVHAAAVFASSASVASHHAHHGGSTTHSHGAASGASPSPFTSPFGSPLMSPHHGPALGHGLGLAHPSPALTAVSSSSGGGGSHNGLLPLTSPLLGGIGLAEEDTAAAVAATRAPGTITGGGGGSWASIARGGSHAHPHGPGHAGLHAAASHGHGHGHAPGHGHAAVGVALPGPVSPPLGPISADARRRRTVSFGDRDRQGQAAAGVHPPAAPGGGAGYPPTHTGAPAAAAAAAGSTAVSAGAAAGAGPVLPRPSPALRGSSAGTTGSGGAGGGAADAHAHGPSGSPPTASGTATPSASPTNAAAATAQQAAEHAAQVALLPTPLAGVLSLDEAAAAMALFPREADELLIAWINGHCARGLSSGTAAAVPGAGGVPFGGSGLGPGGAGLARAGSSGASNAVEEATRFIAAEGDDDEVEAVRVLLAESRGLGGESAALAALLQTMRGARAAATGGAGGAAGGAGSGGGSAAAAGVGRPVGSDAARRLIGSGMGVRPYEIRPTSQEAAFAFRALAALPLQVVHLRVALLRQLNARLARVLEFIDFSAGLAAGASASASVNASAGAGAAGASGAAAHGGGAGVPDGAAASGLHGEAAAAMSALAAALRGDFLAPGGITGALSSLSHLGLLGDSAGGVGGLHGFSLDSDHHHHQHHHLSLDGPSGESVDGPNTDGGAAGAAPGAAAAAALVTVGDAPLSTLLRRVSHLVFSEVKHHLLEAAVEATWGQPGGGARDPYSGMLGNRSGGRPTINIDNAAAMASAEAVRDVGGAGAGASSAGAAGGAGAAAGGGGNAAAAAAASETSLIPPPLPPLRAVDALTSQATFVQAFRQLSRLGDANLCALMRAQLDDRGRLHGVSLIGEAGIDYGGVYRDYATRAIDDVFSPRLDLLLPSPNAQRAAAGAGDVPGAGKFLPNPAYAGGAGAGAGASGGAAGGGSGGGAVSAAAAGGPGGGGIAPAALARILPMYAWLGQLMGMSLRTRSMLGFEFAPLVWKRLVGQPLAFSDLVAIDAATARLVRAVATWTWSPPAAGSGYDGGLGGGMASAAAALGGAGGLGSADSPAPAAGPWFARSASQQSSSSGAAGIISASASPSLSAVAPGTGDAGAAALTAALAAGDVASVLDGSAAGAAFAAAFAGLSFCTVSLDRRRVDLLTGGSEVPLTLGNRAAWVQAMLAFHLTQFDPLLALIARGLYSVVPARALRLLSWQELELAVAGEPHVDIEVFKANTDVEGFRGHNDPNIAMFWRVMEGFSQEERGLFLKFMYGRSRCVAVAAAAACLVLHSAVGCGLFAAALV